MAFNKMSHYSLTTTFFGLLSFALGIAAELKKPLAGIPIQGKGVIICNFPNDPSAVLGFLSVVTLFFTAIAGAISIVVPYGGKYVPLKALFANTLLHVFFHISVVLTLTGAGLTLWATLTELLHQIKNVHLDLDTACPTAKTGLFGGAAFINLDAVLFWLICQMLTCNVRDDHSRTDEDERVHDHTATTD